MRAKLKFCELFFSSLLLFGFLEFLFFCLLPLFFISQELKFSLFLEHFSFLLLFSCLLLHQLLLSSLFGRDGFLFLLGLRFFGQSISYCLLFGSCVCSSFVLSGLLLGCLFFFG